MLGRRVANFEQAVWNRQRYEIAVRASVAKFQQNPLLARYLDGTAEHILAQATALEAVWGIGLSADHPDAVWPSRWRGSNLLGLALMQARQLLRSQA
ncbi:NADAR domain-containing protein [Rhodocyclus tenuis]|uniref:NADAR domain-containing protein n=1 Tax=Rhodocyclus tenuis TaxID=1066 RepID=UPI003B8A792B